LIKRHGIINRPSFAEHLQLPIAQYILDHGVYLGGQPSDVFIKMDDAVPAEN
jgi:hypothetical protein